MIHNVEYKWQDVEIGNKKRAVIPPCDVATPGISNGVVGADDDVELDD